jgi:dephospho-CoA kinase
MIIIGITGSIGTGKTTVSKMLKILRIPVFDSDKKVKEILDKNHFVIKKISKIWPDVISTNQNQNKINKIELSDKIFRSKKERKKLEDIIHPLVEKERNMFLQSSTNFRIVGLDIPLLYEVGLDKKCDYVFLMYTSKKIQKNRVLLRSNMTEKKFELINNAQWSFEKKAKRKPFIINTSFAKVITFVVVLYYLLQIKFRVK